MNRLSWDSTAPNRPNKRSTRDPRPDQRGLEADAELLQVAWDELRRIHRV
jgi:hypothetical protein